MSKWTSTHLLLTQQDCLLPDTLHPTMKEIRFLKLSQSQTTAVESSICRDTKPDSSPLGEVRNSYLPHSNYKKDKTKLCTRAIQHLQNISGARVGWCKTQKFCANWYRRAESSNMYEENPEIGLISAKPVPPHLSVPSRYKQPQTQTNGNLFLFWASRQTTTIANTDSNRGNKEFRGTEGPRIIIQKSNHKFRKTKDCRILFTWHNILQRSYLSWANPTIGLQEAKMIVKCSAESKGKSSYCNATWGYRFDSGYEPAFLSANKLSLQHEQL